VQATDARRNQTQYTYDANGNLTHVDELERSDLGSPAQLFTTTNTFDTLDRLQTTIDGAGNARTFYYDSRSNRVFEVDPLGRQTSYFYDGMDRLDQSFYIL